MLTAFFMPFLNKRPKVNTGGYRPTRTNRDTNERGSKMSKETQTEQGYLRPVGAARYLGISTRCLSEWQRKRLIPYVKAGRKCVLFKKSDLDTALARLRVAAIGEGE
ncbi:MAG: DNA-binding protein [Spartobacteria bacterium]|nr:DNA-binding protein [Spartobacteria bacterium]